MCRRVEVDIYIQDLQTYLGTYLWQLRQYQTGFSAKESFSATIVTYLKARSQDNIRR